MHVPIQRADSASCQEILIVESAESVTRRVLWNPRLPVVNRGQVLDHAAHVGDVDYVAHLMRSASLRRFQLMRMLALTWAIVIGVLLTLPGDSFSSRSHLIPFLIPEWTDKVVHLLLFSIMAWLAYLALRDIASLRFPVLVAGGLALAYGLLLEGLQFYVPGRSPSFGDAVADGVGVLAAAAWCYKSKYAEM